MGDDALTRERTNATTNYNAMLLIVQVLALVLSMVEREVQILVLESGVSNVCKSESDASCSSEDIVAVGIIVIACECDWNSSCNCNCDT